MEKIEYAGFWRRFAAYWIDAACGIPFVILSVVLVRLTPYSQIYMLLPATAFGIWMQIYLVYRYGGSPGKLAMKLRVRKLDGSVVTLKEATLRHSVILGLSVIMSLGLIVAAFGFSTEDWSSLSFPEQSILLVQNAPFWYNWINWAINIWIWSEFVVLLCNEKRRALHDYMAGTVVVRIQSEPSILSAAIPEP